MMCNVLQHPDPMFGMDVHPVIPPSLPPPPFMPPWSGHFVAANLKIGPWGAITGIGYPTIRSDGCETLARGTDIGPLIPHIAVIPPVLHAGMALATLFSGSKSEFGVASVLIGGTPIGVACAVVVNINVNCLGLGVVAVPSSVVAGMTAADFQAGLAASAIDAAISWGLSFACGSAASKMLGPGASAFSSSLLGNGLGLVLGSPIGPSASNMPFLGAHPPDWAPSPDWLPEPLKIHSPIGDPAGELSKGLNTNGDWSTRLQNAMEAAKAEFDRYVSNPLIPQFPGPPLGPLVPPFWPLPVR